MKKYTEIKSLHIIILLCPIVLMFLIIYSCETVLLSPSDRAVCEVRNIDSDSLRNHYAIIDSTKNLLDLSEVIPVAKQTNFQKKERVEYCRYEDGPGDSNINGKPLTVQMEIQEDYYKLIPDTLLLIVKQKYQSWESYFPVSIADNFDEGISTEHIHYPELIVNFQLFEDGYAQSPYLIVPVKVYRDRSGNTHSNFIE
jgi:hypothetical protein